MGSLGDGSAATNAQLSSYVHGITVDTAGNVYVTDSGGYRVRRITGSSGIITTVAGTYTRIYY